MNVRCIHGQYVHVPAKNIRPSTILPTLSFHAVHEIHTSYILFMQYSNSDVFTFLIECETNQIVENGACTDCEPGKQPNMDRNECMDCPSDKVSEDGAMCMICSEGLIPNDGLTACVGKL